MAVTENTYTGNGSTTNYSFTFPYLDTGDIKVTLNGTLTTAYTLANATTISFTSAPANGATIRIYRDTDTTDLKATFFSGSAIRAQDLNSDLLQSLYATQESENEASSATATANTALTNSATAVSTANTAVSTANSAVSTANTASTNASSAVATANTASTNASTAVSTANTASANATTAINTANSATTTANNAVTTANGAVSTANTALTNANAAVSTSNTASTNASAAVSTANTASSNATSAVNTANTATTTANSAVSTANSAVNTANSAVTTANAAAAAVANAVLYTTVANVAAIPGSPANNAAVEVTNSTGIESFTPLSGLPAGFVGSSGLSVRLIYQTAGATWTWIQYFPNDPETRYFKLSGGTITGPITVPQGTVSSPGVKFSGTGNDNTGVYSPGIDELGLVTNGVNRLAIDSAGAVSIPGTLGVTGAITGSLTGSASNNVLKAGDTMTGALAHPLGAAATPSITFTGDTNTGIYSPGADQVAISTGGSGRLFVDASGNINLGQATSALQSGGTGLTIYGATSSEVKFLNSTAGTASTDGTALVSTGNNFAINNREAGYITFGTSNTERLRITDAGLVGVGTSSPTAKTEISYSSTAPSLSSNSGAALALAGTSAVQLNFGTNPSSPYNAWIQTRDTGTNAAFPLSINPLGGNVGIGTSSPLKELQINATTPTIRLEENSAGAKRLELSVNSSAEASVFATQSASQLLFGTVGTERMRIDSSGRLGIGTTTVNRPLVVFNDSVAALSLNNTTTGTAGGDGFQIQLVGSDGYVFNYEAAPVIFGTAATERARIDSSGRLLVGTSSSPGSGDGQYSRLVIQGYVGANTSQGIMSLQRGVTASSITTGQGIGVISFNDSSGGTFSSIYCEADGNGGAGDYPGRLVFSTCPDGSASPVERVRITNAGRFNVVSTEAGVFSETTQSAGTAYVVFQGRYSATAGSALSGTTSFQVFSNGNVQNTNNSYTAISDIKLKENVVDAGSQWADLKAFRVRNYNLKEGQTHRQIGLIAQEVELISPGLVYESPDRDSEGNDLGTVTKSVNYSVLYMKSVKALQEAMERIEVLEQRLTDAGIA